MGLNLHGVEDGRLISVHTPLFDKASLYRRSPADCHNSIVSVCRSLRVLFVEEARISLLVCAIACVASSGQ